MNLIQARWLLLISSVVAVNVVAAPVSFDTLTYNFQLDGGGGGMSVLLDGVSAESFCDDYFGGISWGTAYTANVSGMTSTSNLSNTMFGGVTNWQNTDIGGVTDPNALARYQMVGWLITQYNLSAVPADSPTNDAIQQAIWEILDPAGNPAIANIATTVPVSTYLNAAGAWYSGTTVGQRDSFLSGFEIVSDPGTQNNGQPFQEQIIDDPPSPTPEPRGEAMMIIGLLTVCAFARRRVWNRS